jgi:16S rRNA processing protein RimM
MPQREQPRRLDAAADASPEARIAVPLVVGRFGGAYGVKGWLRVVSFTDPVTNLIRYRPWLLRRDGDWATVNVSACRAHGAGLVAKVEGIDDRSAAERLSGGEIGVPEDVLPSLGADEYYWKDLIGMTVVTTDGTPLGQVSALMETGANDVLVVATDEGEVLIPFVSAVVGHVDAATRRIVVDWTVAASADEE